MYSTIPQDNNHLPLLHRRVGDTSVELSRSQSNAIYAERAAAEPTPDAVKDEAHRRILGIVPEWKQRNLLAQGVVLTDKGRENWTAEELADWDAAQLIWAQVRAIREASDAIEAMQPIPQDYTDDKYWQEQQS